jgi:cytoskeletal protein RodZ
MPTVAEQLRQGREAKNLTVEQVGEITKIRTDHLRALEEGNYDVFIAPVYIRGFVRTYSTVLGLDVPKVMSTLDGELGGTKRFAEPPALTDRRKGLVDLLMLQLSKLDWRAGAALVALIVLGVIAFSAYYFYRNYRTGDPAAGIKPRLYRPANSNSGETLPLTSSPAKK